MVNVVDLAKNTIEQALYETAISEMRDYVNGKGVDDISSATRTAAKYGEFNTIDKYNNGGYDYDQYDTEIIAWSNFWNLELGLTGDSRILPNLVKAMVMAESDGGITSSNDPLQMFNSGDPASYTMARIGQMYQYPNDANIPKNGYAAVKNVFTNGKPDQSKVNCRLSIAFGTRWLGHKIQNANGDRALAVARYNGGGYDRTHGTTNGYLKFVRRVMANPSDYVAGNIDRKGV